MDNEDMKFIAVLGSIFLPAGLVSVSSILQYYKTMIDMPADRMHPSLCSVLIGFNS
jgi:hypothetical protein